MFHRRLTVAQDADGAGKVRCYLPELGVWRLLPLVDAQEQLDNGDVTLEGREDAPLDVHPRVLQHLQNLRGGSDWRPSRKVTTTERLDRGHHEALRERAFAGVAAIPDLDAPAPGVRPS